MQNWIVAVIVIYAFWVVAKRYAPKSVQRLVYDRIAKVSMQLGWMKLSSKFEAKLQTASGCADGCGTCGGCGTDTPPHSTHTITPEALKRTIPR